MNRLSRYHRQQKSNLQKQRGLLRPYALPLHCLILNTRVLNTTKISYGYLVSFSSNIILRSTQYSRCPKDLSEVISQCRILPYFLLLPEYKTLPQQALKMWGAFGTFAVFEESDDTKVIFSRVSPTNAL